MESIIVDTDAGSDVDDFLALAYLANAVPDRLKLVSTVYGPTETRAKAVGTLFRAMGVDVPVVAGACSTITPGHPTWLTGWEDYLVDDSIPVRQNMTEAYLECDSFTLLAIGPLTNVAWQILLNPEFVKHCSRIVIMGGTLHRQILAREHNFQADPMATRCVMASTIPKVLVPLELTAPAPMSDEYFQLFSKSEKDYVKLLWAWIVNWRKITTTGWNVTYPDRVEISQFIPPFFNNVYWHDPIAATYLTHPELFETKLMSAHVDTEGGLVLGSGRPIEVCTAMGIEVIALIAATILDCAPDCKRCGHPDHTGKVCHCLCRHPWPQLASHSR